MKVKRFFAPDMRQAIRMVREEQGPDAVILSNRRVDGGVEIVAATDYSEELFTQFQSDSKPQAPVQTERGAAGVNKYQQYSDAADGESDDLPPPVRAPRAADAPAVSAAAYDHGATVPAQDPLLAQVRDELKTLRAYLETQMAEVAWNNLSKRSPLQAEIVKRGVQFGLSHALARELAHFAQHAVDIDVAWTACLARLAAKIPVADDDMIAQGGIIALVGPTGVGKTTTVAKLAARYALRHGARRIALITTDDYRVGAHEQLRTYGRLLDIPVRSASNAEELQGHLRDFAEKELVFIDTAGISQRDIRLSEQLSLLRDTQLKIKVHLVLAANAQTSGIEEAIDAFKSISLDGCILTKVDEAGVLGGVLSAVIEAGLPLMYVSDGQRVPEDLHLARADKLVSEGLALMRQRRTVDEDEMILAADGRTPRNAH